MEDTWNLIKIDLAPATRTCTRQKRCILRSAYYMVKSASEKNEANPMFWSATKEGKISRFSSLKKKSSLWPYGRSFIHVPWSVLTLMFMQSLDRWILASLTFILKKCWACVLKKQCENACSVLSFISSHSTNDNLKIYSLKFDEIWQKFCSCGTSIDRASN